MNKYSPLFRSSNHSQPIPTENICFCKNVSGLNKYNTDTTLGYYEYVRDPSLFRDDFHLFSFYRVVAPLLFQQIAKANTSRTLPAT